jgi:hypothetical protein
MVLRVDARILVFLPRRLGALDEKPAVLEADDEEVGAPAARLRVLVPWT